MIAKSRFFTVALALGVFNFASPLFADMLAVTNGREGPGELARIELATGAGTLIGSLPDTMTEAVFDAANNRLYAQSSNGGFVLYEIDPSSGAQISSVSTTGAYVGMEFVGSTLYATMITCGGCPSELVTVDPVTGDATVIGSTGYGGISGLAYYSGTMYGMVAGGDPDSGSLVTLDLASGAATMVGPTGYNKVGSIEFGSDGLLYGGLTSSDSTAPNALILIDTATGAGTLVGDTGFSITGLAETFAPTPPPPLGPAEPVPTSSVWALLTLVLLIGMAAFSRRASL